MGMAVLFFALLMGCFGFVIRGALDDVGSIEQVIL
jgi:hypothetical protein